MVRWIIGLSLVAVVLLVSGTSLLIRGWGDGLAGGCENTVVKSVRSADGTLDAVLFERGCGANSGFSTQVSIVVAGERPDGAGNVFITDDDTASDQRGDWGGVWADVSWLSDRRLYINHAPGAGVLKSLTRFDEIAVTYGVAPVPRQSPSPPPAVRSPSS